jgi:lipoate-protein ligase A
METCLKFNEAPSKVWRVILSDHNNAYHNMAMDEAILENFINNDPAPVLRIYGWEPEAFSFGVGQDAEDNFNIEECRKRGMDIVRRMTGGGVLFHSGDISYSIVASLKDLGCEGSVVASYKTICAFLIEMYNGLGLQAGFAAEINNGDSSNFSESCQEKIKTVPLNLCMASNEKYDILVDGKKLGGNAQKRRGSAILQHGSIPLSATFSRSREFVKDPCLVDSLGAISLGEAIGRNISYGEAEERLLDVFKRTFSRSCQLTRNESVSGIAKELLMSKYSTDLWNLERRDDRKKAVLA